jgi:hypothetical protein
MLRECSIAEDHWKKVVDKIKQQEAKMVEEHNNSMNSSSSSSKSSVNGSKQVECGNNVFINIIFLIFYVYRC